MALAGRELSTRREISTGDLIQGMVPVLTPGDPPRVVGAAVVAIHVPQRLEAQVRGIAQAFQEYKQLKLLRQPIKGIYILLFLLMTLVIVFSVTWFGLYLARGITVPIQLLAQGTREVAAGNLDYRVTAQADDEVGILVESFNQMTQDLKSSKAQLELAYADLQAKHAELTERRQYTETVLEAVATGVVSADAAGIVTTVNRAASRMLGLAPTAAVGRHYSVAFGAPAYLDLVTLMQRMERIRAGTIERELQLPLDGKSLTLLTSLTALGGPEGEHLGIVLVFDDLTELLDAQRLAAWREVAQRIAHEIKNPLTPIQLSAQRLRRRLAGRLPDDGGLLEECTATIIGEVEGLRRLVDEFSRFARMPSFTPKSTDLHRLLESVLGLYGETHPAVLLRADFAAELPTLDTDGDQLKRAVLNLVDNAVEAGATEVAIGTRWSGGAHVEVTIADNGPGIAADLRDRVFLPYFSTKTTGMGLGLPIVHQIVSDHGGRIRVEDNPPRGTRFTIELPVLRGSAPAVAAPALDVARQSGSA
jgi:two-component system nitrogen regulation sensor histidine kinase NtrY